MLIPFDKRVCDVERVFFCTELPGFMLRDAAISFVLRHGVQSWRRRSYDIAHRVRFLAHYAARLPLSFAVVGARAGAL